MKVGKISTAVISLSALTLGGCQVKKEEVKRPNILFILSDDHTSQAWGIYGGHLKDYVKNDNIKRLANEGCVLNNAFCTNSISTPSRASILTGQYSHKNGVYTLGQPMHPDSVNIAKTLRNNGYQTAIVGKWHLKTQPAGFDFYSVFPGQGRYWNPLMKSTGDKWTDGWKGGKEYKGFSTDIVAGKAIKWMEETDPNKPFMVMCNFKATHEPFDYPERFKSLYRNVDIPEPETMFDFSPETTGRSFVGQKLENLGWRWEKASADPDKWWCKYPEMPFSTQGMDSVAARKKIYQKFVKDFMRCGAAIDDNIGRLLDYLEKSGKAENTIVIYTADQGYFLGEHGFFDKRLIYEESLRMPFVIRYPKEIKGGQRLDDMILNIDFPALLADYAGLERPDYMQGNSFRENLKGNTSKEWRKSMYYRYWLHAPIRPGHFGIRNERYKLAFFYGQPLGMNGADKKTTAPAWEFFDLQKDPKELHNAYNDKEYETVIAEMKKELIQLREQYGDTDKQYPVMQDIFKTNWEN
ncbi:DUF4976 domain-containing protein [Prolixibacteraceae bacterium JC049]|nr:DUF4976 domain-containing protein [Prolixibacteraceae bacterium JC049]